MALQSDSSFYISSEVTDVNISPEFGDNQTREIRTGNATQGGASVMAKADKAKVGQDADDSEVGVGRGKKSGKGEEEAERGRRSGGGSVEMDVPDSPRLSNNRIAALAAGILVVAAIIGTVGYVAYSGSKDKPSAQFQKAGPEEPTLSPEDVLDLSLQTGDAPSDRSGSVRNMDIEVVNKNAGNKIGQKVCKTKYKQKPCQCAVTDLNNDPEPSKTVLLKEISMGLVIDDTSSMTAILQYLRKGIGPFLEANKKYKIFSEYIVVPFKDSPGKITKTSDPKKAKTAIDVLVASAGASCPEGTIQAIEAAAKLAKNDSIFFVFTDAIPGDVDFMKKTKKILTKKRINVNFVLSNAHRFCDGQEQALHHYIELAQINKGKVTILKERNIQQVISYMGTALKRGVDEFHKMPDNVETIEARTDHNKKCNCPAPDEVMRC